MVLFKQVFPSHSPQSAIPWMIQANFRKFDNQNHFY